jgi:hypothetical protein
MALFLALWLLSFFLGLGIRVLRVPLILGTWLALWFLRSLEHTVSVYLLYAKKYTPFSRYQVREDSKATTLNS